MNFHGFFSVKDTKMCRKLTYSVTYLPHSSAGKRSQLIKVVCGSDIQDEGRLRGGKKCKRPGSLRREQKNKQEEL